MEKTEKSNTNAVIYARVGSFDQNEHGHLHLQQQLQLCRQYAVSQGFNVQHEFSAVGKSSGQMFAEMLQFLKDHPDCHHLVVDKMDRIARNFAEYQKLEALQIKIHLVQEKRTIHGDTKSQDRLVNAMYLLLARNYLENLREEVKHGLRAKAERGVYPGRAPLGYLNNAATRSIELDRKAGRLVRRIFELYATGKYSLAQLRKLIQKQFGLKFSKKRVVHVLNNPFYAGRFEWGAKMYKGTHLTIVEPDTYRKVQRLLRKAQCNDALYTRLSSKNQKHVSTQKQYRRKRESTSGIPMLVKPACKKKATNNK